MKLEDQLRDLSTQIEAHVQSIYQIRMELKSYGLYYDEDAHSEDTPHLDENLKVYLSVKASKLEICFAEHLSVEDVDSILRTYLDLSSKTKHRIVELMTKYHDDDIKRYKLKSKYNDIYDQYRRKKVKVTLELLAIGKADGTYDFGKYTKSITYKVSRGKVRIVNSTPIDRLDASTMKHVYRVFVNCGLLTDIAL